MIKEFLWCIMSKKGGIKMEAKIIGDTLPAVICKLQKGESILTVDGW